MVIRSEKRIGCLAQQGFDEDQGCRIAIDTLAAFVRLDGFEQVLFKGGRVWGSWSLRLVEVETFRACTGYEAVERG
jgi:hypothetical protein